MSFDLDYGLKDRMLRHLHIICKLDLLRIAFENLPIRQDPEVMEKRAYCNYLDDFKCLKCALFVVVGWLAIEVAN